MRDRNLIEVDKQEYQKEQDKLLSTLLQYRFFNPWKNIDECRDARSLQSDSKLELYITSTCNQKCEYCYLHKHPELYPQEYNKPELILQNLEILYKYFVANNFFIPVLDMFSGEIWHTQLGWDILELTYQYTQVGLNYDEILIASNCYFVSDPKTLQIIQGYINKFAQIGVKLVFSISVDGKYIDNEGRPRNDTSRLYTDEFYDELFAFAKHNTFYFHPMVSAHNIHLWNENYKWWREKFKEYNMDFYTAMMLEVRNDEWIDKTIQQYCDFIVKLSDDFLVERCHNDIKLLGDLFISKPTRNLLNVSGYYPWLLSASVDNFVSCTIVSHLCVRLGDLAICPCHRTSYEKYLYGHFIVENDMITGIRANNPQMAIKVLMSNMKTAMHGCDVCILRNACLKGCFGAQLESTGDPFFPCPSVCKLFKKKYFTLIEHYANKGLFEYYKGLSPEQEGAQEALELLQLYKNWEAEINGMGKCE